jgi:hypothetical protein
VIEAVVILLVDPLYPSRRLSPAVSLSATFTRCIPLGDFHPLHLSAPTSSTLPPPVQLERARGKLGGAADRQCRIDDTHAECSAPAIYKTRTRDTHAECSAPAIYKIRTRDTHAECSAPYTLPWAAAAVKCPGQAGCWPIAAAAVQRRIH